MLLLMRPRQSQIPLPIARQPTADLRAAQRRQEYEATRRVDRPDDGELPSVLRELAALRDDGVLTEDEFLAAKTRVLGGEPPVT